MFHTGYFPLPLSRFISFYLSLITLLVFIRYFTPFLLLFFCSYTCCCYHYYCCFCYIIASLFNILYIFFSVLVAIWFCLYLFFIQFILGFFFQCSIIFVINLSVILWFVIRVFVIFQIFVFSFFVSNHTKKFTYILCKNYTMYTTFWPSSFKVYCLDFGTFPFWLYDFTAHE